MLWINFTPNTRKQVLSQVHHLQVQFCCFWRQALINFGPCWDLLTSFLSRIILGNIKPAAEKDGISNFLPKAKAPLPHQKIAHGGFIGKAVKSPADDKVAKIIGHKTAKISIPRISPNALIMQKQAGGNQSVSVKSNRQLNEAMAANVDNPAMNQVLNYITEAAAAQTKRQPLQNPIAKPAAGLTC